MGNTMRRRVAKLMMPARRRLMRVNDEKGFGLQLNHYPVTELLCRCYGQLNSSVKLRTSTFH